MEQIYITIGIFFALQIINVILNTTKTLIMARTDNPHLSAVVNAVTFGFYTAVVKQIAGLDLTITITVTMITNVVGVYVTYWIAGKLKKDNLWKIEVYIKENPAFESFSNFIKTHEIPYVVTSHQFLTIYCYSQEHSKIVGQKIKDCESANTVKYNITEITKRF